MRERYGSGLEESRRELEVMEDGETIIRIYCIKINFQ